MKASHKTIASLNKKKWFDLVSKIQGIFTHAK